VQTQTRAARGGTWGRGKGGVWGRGNVVELLGMWVGPGHEVEGTDLEANRAEAPARRV